MLARVVAVAGPLFCAAGVALGAMAGHAPDAADGRRLGIAALFFFGHGLALCLPAPRGARLLGWARAGLLLGTLLFAGSLVGAAWFDWSTRAAPAGGTLLIVAWLAWAVAAMRPERR